MDRRTQRAAVAGLYGVFTLVLMAVGAGFLIIFGWAPVELGITRYEMWLRVLAVLGV